MSIAANIGWARLDSKTEFSALFEHAPVGLAQCDLRGNITALSPALKRMFEGMWGAPSVSIADLVHPYQHAEYERLFRELCERQRDSFQVDSKAISSNIRQLRWTAWRVPGAEGQPDHALVLAQDTSQGEDAASRLRQAQRLETLGRLAGGIAHDFNNLLTGILLYCDLLASSLEPGGQARKYAEEIRLTGMQASGLVRQLFAVTRPTNSKPQILSFNDIAECMRNLLVRLIGENIELQFHLDPKLGLIKMDPTHSQQILLNLVLNARDAMPGGGQIKVETSNCKVQVLAESNLGASRPTSLPCALVVVSDNGSGMDAATQAHVFEAFFTTKASKGTGLGLATVYDIVTSSGGLIHVDSAPACGTCVSILLPLVPQAVVDAQATADFSPEENREITTVEG